MPEKRLPNIEKMSLDVHAGEVVGGGSRAAEALVAVLVVDLAFLLIAEDLVGGGAVLEGLLGGGIPRVAVGVVLHGEPAVVRLISSASVVFSTPRIS